MFIFHRSIYLLRHERKPQTLNTQYEYLETGTLHTSLEELHTYTPSALRAWQLSIRSVPLSGRNVIPHLYSYSFLMFFTAPFILIVIPKAELILN